MILYVPSSAAESLSNALWGLTRPPEVRTEADTQYLFSWRDDLLGTRQLIVDTEFEILIHADADFAPIGAILQPWINSGHLPADTNTTLAALIDSKRGQYLVVYDAFPAYFKSLAMTQEQMIAAGRMDANATFAVRGL